MRIDSETSSKDQETVADAVRDGLQSFREMLSNVQLLVSATLDRWKLSILMLCLYAVLGVFGAAAGLAVVVTAVVLLLIGAAHGIGAALGGREWLGDLIVGFGLLAILTIGVTSFLERFVSSSKKRTTKKYESRHSTQRQQFGVSAGDRSNASAPYSTNPHAN